MVQFDSNVACTVTYIISAKKFFQNWLVMLPSRTILGCVCALQI